MLKNILGWYSLVIYTIGLVSNMFLEKDNKKRFIWFIVCFPVIVYIYMSMFCQ